MRLIMRNRLQLVLFSALLHVTLSWLHEFVYVPGPMNWTNAQKYCRQHYFDLATVNDQADHDELLKTVGMGHVWLGLSRTTYPGPYVWSDQSSSTFTKWFPGKPDNQLCAKVYNGFWYDSNCKYTNAFACYIDRKRQIVKLEVKSSQNLNDPGVMDKILSKMERILKEKGVTEYAKLSWRTQSDGNVFQKKEQKSDASKQTCVSNLWK
ncbi:macrophage mannose receptor 1-like isoform X1 [Megalobrama amblycephala]|uniref:macrophage mannose receptor 1-like isoform X1 n=2 Tax=Megalobrama amblycephala TaxID=75352 RepID=UPI002013C0EE|nr:macrophage mannose receptor 1-like isoform X1 [Megalobrama amblycephala]